MKHYNVLLVDDDTEVRSSFQRAVDGLLSVKAFTASNVATALDICRREFLHLAIVDMEIDGRADGEKILKTLRDHRPTCKAWLLTAHPSEYRQKFFNALHPLKPSICGAIDKIDEIDWAAYLTGAFGAWIANPIQVGDLDQIYTALLSRVEGVTRDEIDYLISRVLGQRLALPIGRSDRQEKSLEIGHGVAKVDLRLLTGGRSSSVVLLGQPESSKGTKGIWTVIKIGKKIDGEQEYLRHAQHVKYSVSKDFRVELLHFEPGDSLSAVCYTFAGQSPSRVQSLQEMIEQEQNECFAVLDRLFGEGSSFWYRTSGDSISVKQFLSGKYDIDFAALAKSYTGVIEVLLNRRIGELRSRGSLKINGFSFPSSDELFAAGSLVRPMPTSIVHGDLNANNIIVGDGGRPVLIDYRHTGYAPRCLDFAALECTLRLRVPDLLTETAISNIVAIERDVQRRVWGDFGATPDLETPLPFWAKISLALGRFARANFVDVTKAEYCLSCLGWGEPPRESRRLVDLSYAASAGVSSEA